LGIFLLAASLSYAASGNIATEEQITNLKRDLLGGLVQTGKTRINEIKQAYGEAATIDDSSKKVVYDYGGLKVTFEKKRYLRDWEYDYSHKTAYTDDVDSLRSDLESQEIVGDFITLVEIKKDYDEPTEAYETYEDGGTSIYYYGEIKLIFENYIVIQKWKGQGLDEIEDSKVFQTESTELKEE